LWADIGKASETSRTVFKTLGDSEMSHEPFEIIDDDKAYLAWTAENPGAFVINKWKGKSAKYLVLHRAKCPSITSHTKMARPGGFTERHYSKVCGMTVTALVQWLELRQLRITCECSKCRPK
jgi:hypothetical protein